MRAIGQIITSTGAIGVDQSGGVSGRGGDSGNGGECGNNARLPLVLLHGVGSDKSVWRPQLDHFDAERRTVAVDFPGYGESDFLGSPTLEDFAGAILGAMDALGIDRAHICGLSLGGVVAIELHHSTPARCASLILAHSFAVHPDGRAIYDQLIAASADMAAMALARVPLLVAAGTDRALCDHLAQTMAAIDPAAFALAARAVWLADQRHRLSSIAVPVLVIVGAEDRVTPPALSHALAAGIAHSCLVEIAGAGHLSNIEQPGVFNRAVDQFLSGIELKGQCLPPL